MSTNSYELLKIYHAVNTCPVPTCASGAVFVTVTVLYENGDPYPNVNVRAFISETPSGYTAVTDAAGQAVIYAPAENYRFAADIKGTLFYSDETNHCAIPGCLTATIEIPGGYEYQE
ncbi:MAG: carboxypeptidase-like regulatory domain-containing protein [Anaerolineaceae bacterium]